MAGYLAHEKSPFRRYGIVAGVIAFHVLLLHYLTGWPSPHHTPEILIRAKIFPEKPPT